MDSPAERPFRNIQIIDGDHELDLVADAVGIPHCSIQFTPLTSIPGISLLCCDLLGYKHSYSLGIVNLLLLDNCRPRYPIYSF